MLQLCHRGRRHNDRAGGCSCLIALVAAIGFLATALPAPPVRGAPYVPSDDSQPLERLPSVGNAAIRALRADHVELARSPRNLALAVSLARRDIEVARTEADPRYNGYAEAALAPWIKLPDPPIEVLVLRATLRQATHDFEPALADLAQALANDPANAQARLIRAVIFEVQGNYTNALGNCLSLRQFAESLVTAICVDSVLSLTGKARAGADDLRVMLDRAPAGESAQIRLWALTILAETEARLGDAVGADVSFRAALDLGVRDVYLLGAYADFLLDEGRAGDVQTMLRDEVRIDPLLLRLALAEQRLGRPELATHIADLSERFEEARLRGDNIHQREEARFALDLLKRPVEALRLAKANWGVQHEPWDVRLLIETALAANQPESARPALDFFSKSRLEDVRIERLAAQATVSR